MSAHKAPILVLPQLIIQSSLCSTRLQGGEFRSITTVSTEHGYPCSAAANRSEKHCLHIKGTFRTSYPQENVSILFLPTAGGEFYSYLFANQAKNEQGYTACREDDNSVSNWRISGCLDIAALSAAFSSTCCSSRGTGS